MILGSPGTFSLLKPPPQFGRSSSLSQTIFEATIVIFSGSVGVSYLLSTTKVLSSRLDERTICPSVFIFLVPSSESSSLNNSPLYGEKLLGIVSCPVNRSL